jgi:hypothetical protein
MTNGRYGNFSLSTELVRQQPGFVTRIMGACIILRCEHNYMTRRFEYQAISNKFEAIPDCQIPHDYVWQVSEQGDIEAIKQ